MLFNELLISSLVAAAVLLIWFVRRVGRAENAMAVEALRSDALGRLARGDSMTHILGILAATIHISCPQLQCSISLEGKPDAIPPSPSRTSWPVIMPDGRQAASLLVESRSKPPSRHQIELIERVAKLAAIVIAHRTLQDQWRHEATHDALTGMANRRAFTERINALDRCSREDYSASVFFIDLDGFKQINDGFGHEVGDLFLREAAARIRSCFPASDMVARVGGDEFVAFAEGLTPPDVAAACTRIMERVRTPFQAGDLRLFASASIGVSTWPDDGLTAADIQRNADWALYEAKEQGKNRYRVYSPAMRLREETRRQKEQLVRHALDAGLFELFYQPQVSPDGRTVGLEALARIRHPEAGLIMPADFIHIAEESGMIAQIDLWVLAEACRQHSAWRLEGLQPVRIAVNVSRASLGTADFAHQICSTMRRAGVDPSAIQIELTEGAMLQEGDVPIETLQKLSEAGISLALDDFGTGYSSLSCLYALPVDTVKIDKSFVRRLGEDANSLPLVQAIMVAARALGLVTVAEGIETAEQMSVMCSLGCEILQGNYISRPVPASGVLMKAAQAA